ncbi:MAG TPA: hypothetical protein VNO31_15740, partial [Umezawaea sp.]|nr:hypothetical protein [Umezawaea sp.]
WRFAFRGVEWRWGNAGRFVRARRRALVLQGGMLSVAFLVFDVGAEALVGRDGLALLLFVKNPTVIAFTVIWLIGVLREMLTTGHEPPQGASLEWNVPSGKGSGSGGR